MIERGAVKLECIHEVFPFRGETVFPQVGLDEMPDGVHAVACYFRHSSHLAADQLVVPVPRLSHFSGNELIVVLALPQEVRGIRRVELPERSANTNSKRGATPFN